MGLSSVTHSVQNIPPRQGRNTDLLQKRRQDLPDPESLRELIQDTSQTFHERDLLLSALRGKVGSVKEIEGGYWQ